MSEQPKPPPERFELILRTMPGSDVPASQRLGMLLKVLKRYWKFHCESVRPLTEQPKEVAHDQP